MIKRIHCLPMLLVIFASVLVDAQTGLSALKPQSLLLKSSSQKNIVETARNHQWSVDFSKNGVDTVLVIAVRVEFKPDTSTLTTGNGRFGLKGDTKELRFYNADTVYKYDKLPHDSAYFGHQLTALTNYYAKASRGKLKVDFSLYPSGGGETGYEVPNQMTYYSPGWKRKRETRDAYWERKTRGLMMFVKDAVEAASNKGVDSPFRGLYKDERGILREAATGRKAAILILHAGASYMTDGGLEGAASADSPSDMIDAFINRDYFKYYKDSLKLDSAGINVIGAEGKTLTIDEVMMCAETSNQDGLNWGIQGILVNQLARQLGIPDLFSTSSGVSAIGAFCIMDFAGYSAGQGFIPPYPSAWVRAFMGWDKPYTVGAGEKYGVKALTSVIDNDDAGRTSGNDTTILLIPLNNNEYYLVENRQRNLSGVDSAFKYDEGSIISAYPFNVNIDANVKSFANGVIVKTKNNDVSLPASGVLVWHVDERVIRQKLEYNIVNADSSYRGVRLVEADGINDLGVTFKDAFYQAAFDYGGAEDVFPHKSIRGDKSKADAEVSGFGPYSRPSSRSNDGGHTYLNININYAGGSPKTERSISFQNDTIVNYSDTSFIVDIRYDYLTPGWPRRAAPETSFFDPLVTEIASSSSSNNNKSNTVLTLLGESGRFYMYPVNDNDTAMYSDSIPGAFTFPTAIGGKIYVPASSTQSTEASSLSKRLSPKTTKSSKLMSPRLSKTSQADAAVYVYASVDIKDITKIPLPAAPSSYVCGIGGNSWAVGLADGRIIVGVDTSIVDTIILNTVSPICAIAAVKDKDALSGFAAVQESGAIFIINKQNKVSDSTKIAKGIPPFTIVTGDLDNDGKSEIIVSDSRQGVWVYTRELKLAQGWKDDPNDWANAYYVDPQKRSGVDRNRYPKNHSAPALVDLNRNGNLDIIVSGINGIYALNRKGALLSRWPAYLDNRYWYQRGSVTTSPIVVSSNKNEPLVLFSSPTGERATFAVAKIITADKKTGVVTFRRDDGKLDSLWDMSEKSIDTILTIGDSLVYPYTLPGGFVDALTSGASRPVSKIGSWPIPQSRWPLSTGAPVTTSPLVYRASPNAAPSLFAVSSDGMVYRWELSNDMRVDSLYWPQNGFNAERSFAYGGPSTPTEDIVKESKEPITFWNYPNPTSKTEPYTTFKYQFNSKAKNVRLDIHTITGYKMDTFKNLSGDFPGWNEFTVNLKKYGPGIYRCRMEAEVNGKKHSKFWKMAVVK
jgi:hypothetical protein